MFDHPIHINEIEGLIPKRKLLSYSAYLTRQLLVYGYRFIRIQAYYRSHLLVKMQRGLTLAGAEIQYSHIGPEILANHSSEELGSVDPCRIGIVEPGP